MKLHLKIMSFGKSWFWFGFAGGAWIPMRPVLQASPRQAAEEFATRIRLRKLSPAER